MLGHLPCFHSTSYRTLFTFEPTLRLSPNFCSVQYLYPFVPTSLIALLMMDAHTTRACVLFSHPANFSPVCISCTKQTASKPWCRQHFSTGLRAVGYLLYGVMLSCKLHPCDQPWLKPPSIHALLWLFRSRKLCVKAAQ